MNWKKSLEGAAVAAFSAVFAAAAPLITDGKITQSEGLMLVVLFGSVFFSYLKTHDSGETK